LSQYTIQANQTYYPTEKLERINPEPIYEEPQVDCCLASTDPLLSGPGRNDCIVATVFFILFVLLILIGTITTVLHYAARIEFATENRGRVLGPVMLGLSPIPLLFMIFFIYRAKANVEYELEQLEMTNSARQRIAYRQHQAQLARESTLYSSTYSDHAPYRA
uniref:Transmembrane protein n=1 Tax=Echinostoma caproni TaxID=27848 RepID=A0A183ACS8_9TREM